MRHAKKIVKLNKSTSHRRAMWSNMSIALLNHEQIKTTIPKAKFLRSYVEKLITRAKKGGLANKRYLLSVLYNDHAIVNKMLNELANRYQNRNGGYTRILKAGYRYGDAAPMAYIELVERNEAVKGKQDNSLEQNQKAKQE